MKKIILDLDTGIDDTLAIVYTLAAPDAELIGITGAFGNVSMDLGVKNALGILAMFGQDGIPSIMAATAVCPPAHLMSRPGKSTLSGMDITESAM